MVILAPWRPRLDASTMLHGFHRGPDSVSPMVEISRSVGDVADGVTPIRACLRNLSFLPTCFGVAVRSTYLGSLREGGQIFCTNFCRDKSPSRRTTPPAYTSGMTTAASSIVTFYVLVGSSTCRNMGLCPDPVSPKAVPLSLEHETGHASNP